MPSSQADAPSAGGRRARQPSAVEWLARLEAGELSARELTQHYIERAGEANARLNALIAFDAEAALSAADAADAARARGERLPLLGLPVTVKDSLDVAGLPATGGSLARAGHVPERDATTVRRLRDAGATVLAKTNLPEYSSSYETDNLVQGRTLHPLDPDRTPGGSSGGEAALAAADATPLGLGTDGGGSIRVPAHYCGVFGLRPTVGRVPMTGNWPATRASGYADLYCAGPIARFAGDLALVLPLIAGPDGADPYAVPAPLASEPPDPGALRVGWFVDSPRVAVTPGTEAAVTAAVRSLADAGASVGPVEAPWDPDPTELFMTAVVADGGAQARADVAAAGGRHHPQFQEFLDAAAERALSAEQWFAVQRDVFGLRAAMRRLLDGLDVLVCPVAAGPAPRHGTPPAGLPQEEYGRYRAFDFVHLIAIAGLPAASVPMSSEDGLPVGVQVVGPPFREDLVIGAAAVLESASDAAALVATGEAAP
jgi:Asp-tRNA(Asn)/Glu-tRNA(Gln) amidotransferase A subunit family amidase